ncbi:MAG: SusC/RagA family TonB-linked outer membrane protein [Bacteroides sp.]|nr:SusC/RagA family TonB-linked outer membrane protein [Bacteroides sp.]
MLPLLAFLSMPIMAQQDNIKAEEKAGDDFTGQTIDVGANKTFTLEESTASVAVIRNSDFNHRSAKNIGWDIVGQGLGMFSKEGQGIYGSTNASFTIRGLQSLSGSSPLLLVDGVQRGISDLSPEEVESVSILKDAAAVALYGQMGANGAILITTKRGEYDSRHVKVTYDHVYGYLSNKPKFVDAYTYANAVNEAMGYEGSDPMYSSYELAAFRDGTYPTYYPNVNWVNETFRNHDVSNKYVVEFYGGTSKFRYYTMANLLTNKGFIKNPNMNDGYSTQDKYVRGNLRTNMDVELTPTTHLKANLAGILMEQSMPGSEADLWDMVYDIPALAFPIQDETGLWGGSASWSGEKNPVAQSQAAGYYKLHKRSLYSDFTLDQDLSVLLKGLSATARVAYDHNSTLYEDHSKTYKMGMSSVSWVDGAIDESSVTRYTDGEDGTLGDDAENELFNRRFLFDVGFNFNRSFGKHELYSQLRWQYEFCDTETTNTTIYRQNASLWAHYGYDKRYYADLALVGVGSSKLAPGHKWAFSPTLSAAWVISREAFMEDASWVDYLKLRASAGIIQLDLLPGDDDEWLYYEQGYTVGSGSYYYTNSYTGGTSTLLGRMPTENPSHEKAYKYNVGVDARLFGSLNVNFDAYYQQRKDIWVETDGMYSAVVGQDAPYENVGEVKSWGWELGLDYTKTLGDVTFNVGAQFNYNRNQIIEQAEEPRLYENLVQTGHDVGQIYGLKAIGLLTEQDITNMSLDEDDADYVPTQSFGTVRAGDIKYEDVNGDGKVDTNDEIAIGHSTTPQIYYNLRLGAEWKGLGFYALFQGTARYSGTLNTSGMYWPLLNKTSLSQYAYDNRWTPENPDAALPRLSTTSNSNNYQTSTWWVKDRSFFKLRSLEVYYNLPKNLLDKTKVVNAAKVYVRGNDLFCKDHIPVGDAEGYAAAQPMTRSIAMGLQVTF